MFIDDLKKIIDSNQSRSIFVTGNIHDLYSHDGRNYVPLIEYIADAIKAKPTPTHKGIVQLICRLNKSIELRGEGAAEFELQWDATKPQKSMKERLEEARNNANYMLELVSKLIQFNRANLKSRHNIVAIIESADFILPNAEIDRMSFQDKAKLAAVQNLFCDADFVNGGDTVILLSDTISKVHQNITSLPQVISLKLPLPDLEARQAYIDSYQIKSEHLAKNSAGLSIYALRRLIKSGEYDNQDAVSAQVEQYMISQLGEGVVEFKRPKHRFDKVVGNTKVKKFFQVYLVPAIQTDDPDLALAGAAIGGPIGGGKTFICEALAAELGVPVIILKNIRSKWFGETDSLFEKIRMLISSFHKVVIFVDEADTQFGSVGEDAHETERRLTGKLQAMMSDTALLGKVCWLLMTARIHNLSPDIRRPGRMDLVIPILDPVGEDRTEFVRWTLGKIPVEDKDDGFLKQLETITKDYSAASFQMLRTEIKKQQCRNLEDVVNIANDLLSPDIEETRRYQILQAQLNCTRRSLLDYEGDIQTARKKWKQEIRELELQGIN